MPALVLGLADILDADVEQAPMETGEGAVLRLLDFDREPLATAAIAAPGAAAGFEALRENRAALALADRPISDDEVAAFAKSGLGDMRAAGREHVVALDGLAIITAPGNPVAALTLPEIAGIFSGAIRDWGEVGGQAGPISTHAPGEGSDDAAAFDAMALAPNRATLAAGATRHADSAALEAAVMADPGAIGVIRLSALRAATPLGLRDACGRVSKPDDFSMKSEEYPLSRRLFLYANGQTSTNWTRDMLDFALSAEAQEIVADAGFVNQDVVAQPVERMVDRLMLAITDPFANVNLEQIRAFAAEIGNATRLSTTLRQRPGGGELDARAKTDIPRLIDYLAQQDLRGREVLLIGFTDPVGKASTNRARSLARAQQALEAIQEMTPAGVLDGLEMRALGFGETGPAVCNAKAGGDAANRRVEVWLKPKG
jgi:phosphate transport system substrate-binding protein